MLAGLVDGDGHYDTHDGGHQYQIRAKDVDVIHDYQLLARSLGIRASNILDTRAVNEETGEEYDGFKIDMSGGRCGSVLSTACSGTSALRGQVTLATSTSHRATAVMCSASCLLRLDSMYDSLSTPSSNTTTSRSTWARSAGHSA